MSLCCHLKEAPLLWVNKKAKHFVISAEGDNQQSQRNSISAVTLLPLKAFKVINGTIPQRTIKNWCPTSRWKALTTWNGGISPSFNYTAVDILLSAGKCWSEDSRCGVKVLAMLTRRFFGRFGCQRDRWKHFCLTQPHFNGRGTGSVHNDGALDYKKLANVVSYNFHPKIVSNHSSSTRSN